MRDTLAFLTQAGPLAIAPRYLGFMLSVLQGHSVPPPQTTPLFRGQLLRGTTVVDGTAVIPVTGPIFHRADLFSLFGAVAIDDLRVTMQTALEDATIERILLVIDSPGGEVAGVADLADALYAARRRKPMAAVADEGMHSAAYWLGSAVGPVSLPRTGSVGSVGALVVHADVSGQLAQAGVRVTVVKSGPKKAQFSPFQPLSLDARTALQDEVDRVAGLFMAAVARHRGLTVDTVQGFEGGTFEGGAAVTAGLADAVSTLDDAFLALHAPPQSGARRRERMTTMAEDHSKDTDAVPAPLEQEQLETEARKVAKGQIFDLQKAHEIAKKRATDKAIADERLRAAEITRWCAFAGKPDLSEGYIAGDLSLEGIRNELLSQTASAGFEITAGRSAIVHRPTLTIDEIYARRREQVAQAQHGRRIG